MRPKRKEGHEIIIAGDFNNNFDDKDAEINRTMREWGLRNILKERLGLGPATHTNTGREID